MARSGTISHLLRRSAAVFLYLSRLFVLTLWLGIFPQAAWATDVIVGIVSSIDREGGIITLSPIVAIGDESSQGTTVSLDSDKLPDDLALGDTVRAWGEFESDAATATFKASTLRKKTSAGSGTSDPTGVRSRLGDGWQGGRMNRGASRGR